MKTKTYKRFRLTYLSGVDRPAQEPAQALMILKRREEFAPDDQTVRDGAKRTQMDEIAKLQKRIAAQLSLTGAQHDYFVGLPETQREAFLDLSPTGREVEVSKARDADPFVVDFEDIKVRKSAGETAIMLAQSLVKERKARQDDQRRVVEAEGIAKAERLMKRAKDELPHLTGTDALKVALLGAVDGIENEEVRKGCLQILHSHNAALSDVGVRRGVGGDTIVKGADTATDRLIAKAKELAKKDGKEFSVAYAEVVQSAEGRTLRSEADDEREAAEAAARRGRR